MIDRYEKKTCNGCKTCAEICPKAAISYQIDDFGFWFPHVDYSKCIECGLCIKRCPNKNVRQSRMNMPIVKAVWSKDDSVRLGSTSGGLFFELARRILTDDGYVVGCEYDEDYKGAHHVIIHTFDELEPLMVSKYVESDTEGIYKRTRDVLSTGKQVLFVGSPCQCAGLNSYLNKEYSNLIVVDFLCRGTNSPKAHRKYIEYLENTYGARVTYLRSKDKRNGWEYFGQAAKFENGKEYFAPRTEDLRVVAYHRGNLMVRECCVDCKFKTLPRHSDITLGDFWGIKAEEVRDIDKGVSLCFINSEKGKQMMNLISDRIEQIDKTIEDAKNGNPAIYQSASCSSNREIFLSNLDNIPFDKLVDKYKTKEPSLMQRAWYKIYNVLRGDK